MLNGKSLVWILHEAFVLLFQGRHDAVVGLVHRGLHVLRALSYRIDGLVDGQS